MKTGVRNTKKYRNLQRMAVVGGIIVNVLCAFITYHFNVPIYLDCIGTMGVAAVCGAFPGVLVAVLTNIFCGWFNSNSFYYVFISVIIALVTADFIRCKNHKKSKWYIIFYWLLISLFGGVLGTGFQWILFGDNQFFYVTETAEALAVSTGWNYFIASMLANFGLNLVDKGICTLVVLMVTYFLPEEELYVLWYSGWKQRPMSDEDIRNNNSVLQKGEYSIRGKIAMLITVAVIAITAVMSWISVTQYKRTAREEYRQSAVSTAYATATIINGDKVDDYLRYGESASGFYETKKAMNAIRDASSCVKYLYVLKIGEDACYAVIDLDPLNEGDEEAYAPGDRIDFEEEFEPYMDKLMAGEEIEPIESENGLSGWVLTAYAPVKDSAGTTVAYVGADVGMEFLNGFVTRFIIEVLMIFSGFFVLILVSGMWLTGVYMVLPITSLVSWADGFVTNSKNQEDLDDSVRKLRDIEIHTNDEVEILYRSLCRMAVDTANQVRDINYFADATSKMQNGLIVTMADMVENRDSDTGAHVQKTAAYVKIIAESLKKNGYYVEKLTPKYMSDVVMSAPLHDVGKINISDTILNKPGKLTDEEYEIMKTHTTFGKEIMEKAIATVEGENYLKEARNMAAYHHERWDGKGYPEGLRGEVIPLSARIMAVADVFDALTSPRVYKPAFPLEKALQIMEEGSGTQFDPKCINAFLDALPEVKLVLKKYQEM